MRTLAYIRKEAVQAVNDPIGLGLALVVPLLVVWVFSLVDVGVVDLPGRFRETSPVSLVLCLSIWLSALTMSATALYREKLSGTLSRLSVTPFSPALMMASKMVVLGGLSILQAMIVWVAGRLLLDEQMVRANDLGGLFGLAILGFATSALGLLLSTWLTSPVQISNVLTFLTLAVVTLSGFFKPVEDLGRIQGVAQVLPFTLGYDAMRDVIDGARAPWSTMFALAVEGLVFLVLAWFVLKKFGMVRTVR